MLHAYRLKETQDAIPWELGGSAPQNYPKSDVSHNLTLKD